MRVYGNEKGGMGMKECGNEAVCDCMSVLKFKFFSIRMHSSKF